MYGCGSAMRLDTMTKCDNDARDSDSKDNNGCDKSMYVRFICRRANYTQKHAGFVPMALIKRPNLHDT